MNIIDNDRVLIGWKILNIRCLYFENKARLLQFISKQIEETEFGFGDPNFERENTPSSINLMRGCVSSY